MVLEDDCPCIRIDTGQVQRLVPSRPVGYQGCHHGGSGARVEPRKGIIAESSLLHSKQKWCMDDSSKEKKSITNNLIPVKNTEQVSNQCFLFNVLFLI